MEIEGRLLLRGNRAADQCLGNGRLFDSIIRMYVLVPIGTTPPCLPTLYLLYTSAKIRGISAHAKLNRGFHDFH